MDDPHCSEMEAIHSLHKKLDDDANGNIDITESTGVSDKNGGGSKGPQELMEIVCSFL